MLVRIYVCVYVCVHVRARVCALCDGIWFATVYAVFAHCEDVPSLHWQCAQVHMY